MASSMKRTAKKLPEQDTKLRGSASLEGTHRSSGCSDKRRLRHGPAAAGGTGPSCPAGGTRAPPPLHKTAGGTRLSTCTLGSGAGDADVDTKVGSALLAAPGAGHTPAVVLSRTLLGCETGKPAMRRQWRRRPCTAPSGGHGPRGGAGAGGSERGIRSPAGGVLTTREPWPGVRETGPQVCEDATARHLAEGHRGRSASLTTACGSAAHTTTSNAPPKRSQLVAQSNSEFGPPSPGPEGSSDGRLGKHLAPLWSRLLHPCPRPGLPFTATCARGLAGEARGGCTQRPGRAYLTPRCPRVLGAQASHGEETPS